jgi:uncharacterized membrane protein YqaE (UPF0057 family)
MVVKRMIIGSMNVLFPPFAVYMLCGAGGDLLLNSILFLLAVIPSHIHGFYISCTYFHRKRKARRGVYPGPPKHLIYSSKIQNGGASRTEVRRMKAEAEYQKAQQKPGLVSRAYNRLSGQSSSDYYDEKPIEIIYTDTGHAQGRRTDQWVREQRRLTT